MLTHRRADALGAHGDPLVRYLPKLPIIVLGLSAIAVLVYFLQRPDSSPRPAEGANDAGPEEQTKPAKPGSLGRSRSSRPGAIVQRSDGILTDGPVEKPLHIRSSLPPLTTVAVSDLPKVDHGIPMPDGSFLPLLNGMTQAPPINREKPFGDPGPIVAKTVDSAGFEWWIHADGSTTTSKYKEVVLQDGTRYWDPASFHNAVMPKDAVVEIDDKGKPTDPANRTRK